MPALRIRQIRQHDVAAAVRHAAGLAELVSRFGTEITALAQEVHAASSPLSFWNASMPARGIYGAIRFGFHGTGRIAALGGRVVGSEPAPDSWLDVQSALNGAFGHLFAESDNAFALPMSLHRREPAQRAERLIVFVHGLCMNERAWQKPAHANFAEWAHVHLAARVAYLRYNTGLRISTNGAHLAELLEREAPERELILVGHSMGGLLALGAVHQALERGFDWPQRVTRLACLGAPHEGASLERAGNHANRALGVSPWTRPFMRLGNLRSDGIRDLRFGHVIEDDWRDRHTDDPRRAHSNVRLAAHVDHLFVAATRSAENAVDLRGDWLVSVPSGLASTLHPADAARRELIRDLDHLGLLADERVYRSLRNWLGDRQS